MLREFRARLPVEHNPTIDSAVAPPAGFDVRHQRGERVLSPGDRGDNLFLAHGGISNPLSALSDLFPTAPVSHGAPDGFLRRLRAVRRAIVPV